MILYDQNYDFLGISSDTLSFLGYEDMNEFLALQSDFADLLVEKDGYVYKFNNFSWIDFILFSGTVNKKAIIRLKNNKELEINIQAKEIYLAKDSDMKYYMVELDKDFLTLQTEDQPTNQNSQLGTFKLSQSLTQITSTPKEKEPQVQQEPLESIKEEPIKSFILDISEPSQKQEPNHQESSQTITQNSSGDFKLNFENLNIPTTKEKEIQNSSQDEIKPLDLNIQPPKTIENEEIQQSKPLHDILEPKEIEQEPILKQEPLHDIPQPELEKNKSSFLNIEKFESLKQQTAKEEPKPNSLLSKLLKANREKKEKLQDKQSHIEEEKPTDTVPKEQTIQDINTKSETPQPTSVNNLNFLKTDDEPKVESKTESTNSLNFLKIDDEPKVTDRDSLNFLKTSNDQIKPKDPIESIEKEPMIKEDSNKTLADKLNFLKPQDSTQDEPIKPLFQKEEKTEDEPMPNLFKKESPQDESIKPLFEKEDNASDDLIPNLLKRDDESENEKESIIGQIKNDILEIDDTLQNSTNESISVTPSKEEDRAFQSRLKSLFKENQPKNESPTQQHYSPTSFKLKSQDPKPDSEPKNRSQSNQSSLMQILKRSQNETEEQEIKTILPTQLSKNEESNSQFSLSSLGLSREEEYELVSDFVAESKINIAMLNDFAQSSDYENIIYTLVKLYSSAEILGLNTIIEITQKMRQECENKNIDMVFKLNQQLQEQVIALEEHFKQL